MRTITEIQADILTLREAKLKVLSGKSVKSLTIGSDNLSRRYSYQEINIKMLNYELANLEKELEAAEASIDAEVRLIGFKTSRTHNLRIDTRGI